MGEGGDACIHFFHTSYSLIHFIIYFHFAFAPIVYAIKQTGSVCVRVKHHILLSTLLPELTVYKEQTSLGRKMSACSIQHAKWWWLLQQHLHTCTYFNVNNHCQFLKLIFHILTWITDFTFFTVKLACTALFSKDSSMPSPTCATMSSSCKVSWCFSLLLDRCFLLKLTQNKRWKQFFSNAQKAYSDMISVWTCIRIYNGNSWDLRKKNTIFQRKLLHTERMFWNEFSVFSNIFSLIFKMLWQLPTTNQILGLLCERCIYYKQSWYKQKKTKKTFS